MEFVLTLKDALNRSARRATPRQLRETASSFLIPFEYAILNEIPCPQCGDHGWEQTKTVSLNPRKDLDWPYLCPGGDEHHCICKSCGHPMTVTFWFTK